MKRKVLIVGINSFLGKRLAAKLALFYEVIGAFHKNTDEEIRHYPLVHVDDIFKIGTDVEDVFIIAAYVPYTFSDDVTQRLYHANILLAEKICKHFTQSKIIFCSTVSVYENIVNGEHINERTVVNFKNEYAISKYWGEQIVSRQKKHAIVRFSSIYGEGMNNHTFIPKIVDQAITEKRIKLYGNGSRKQNYIYVDDAAQILTKIAGLDESTLILGINAVSYTNFEIAKIVADQTNAEIEFVGEDKSVSYIYDNGKFVKLLGNEFEYTNIETGLYNFTSWKKKTVLVTGIGGNVGQGIIRNIRYTKFPVKVIGCNVTSFSAGNHLCDAFHKTPFAYEHDYITTINQIIEKEKIDLILPSTDYEVYYLAKFINDVKCEVAVSDEPTAKIYLDKYLSYSHHKKHQISFATSYLPSEYNGELKGKDVIVKPREGRGSRGIYINPENPKSFSDDYIIQERHFGKEVTTAFYVKKDGSLHGLISLDRSLENGATSQCSVIKEYDKKLEQILKKLLTVTSIKGSANIQSIIEEKGAIHPFEINCRISGTNSIRSQLGFEDVKYTLQEYLYNQEPETPKVINGVAVRILMDVIYPHAVNSAALRDNKSDFYIY